jgi:predicted RND superfamily exporter protein
VLAETPEPFAEGALAGLRKLEGTLARVPRVTAVSALSIFERLRPDLAGAPHETEDLRAFVARAGLLRREGFVGDGFLGLVLVLDVHGGAQRDETLAAIEQAIEQAAVTPPSLDAAVAPPNASAGAPFTRLRRIGEPFVESWLERETAQASARYFPLFGAFLVALVLFLYRSKRALAAILLTLGISVLFGTAVAGLLGFTSSIVSALVPLTLMITTTASLVYLHSRYVDHPPGVAMDEHQIFALANKFLAVTASIFATAVGFAALAVSRIRPIREMGLWTAGGLVIVWLASFTLFPALQRLLRTPGRAERAVAGGWVLRAAEVLPRWSYRWRWPLVATAAILTAAGFVAIFGWRGRLPPMPLQTESLDYVDPRAAIYADTRYFRDHVAGLASVEAWVRTPPGGVLDVAFLGALDRFTSALESDRRVGSVVGLPSVLRFRRDAAASGAVAAAPAEGAEPSPALRPAVAASPELSAPDLTRLVTDLDQLLLTEESLRSFVDMADLASTHLTVVASRDGEVSAADLVAAVRERWAAAAAREPALAGATMQPVGQGLVSAKIASHLVPTLVESFCLTAAIIFVTFFAVFRSGAARLMAMVPSLFAILVMFLLMRVTGIPLNVATILIATTVLGATENDQIHFFFHFQERRRDGTCEQALRHAIRVAGSAIFFATLINAGGFLALALSPLPPMRQFGILAASAFALSMLADFTALPAALWIVFRERPDGRDPG